MQHFKQYFIIPVEPEYLYAALTNEATIMLWSGSPAVMKEEVDSEFSLWDESIVGKNIAFEPGKKIVQEWYFGEEQAEPSIVTLKLHAHKKGTSLEVNHSNIPDDAFADISKGWVDVYMASLMDFYSEEE